MLFHTFSTTMFNVLVWILVLFCADKRKALATVPSADSFSTCLPNAIPASSRKNIWELDSSDGLPLGIVVLDWTSARIGSYVVKYLVDEVLGYNTVFSCAAGDTVHGYLCVGNCQRPEDANNPGCDATRVSHSSVNHVSWELWDGSWKASIDAISAQLLNDAPEKVGTVGFIGNEGIWVRDSEVGAVYNQTGLLLEYYRSWSKSRFDPASYFTSLSAIPDEMLMPCKDTALYRTVPVTKYRDITGDVDGVETDANGNLVAKCSGQTASGAMGRYWMSPACRANPTKCVLFHTGGTGWYVNTAMYQAAGNELPIAIGVAANYDKYKELTQNHAVLMYWWSPDMTFLELGPHLVRFPPNDPAAWARGDEKTERRPTEISKFANPLLKDESQIYAFFVNMEISQTQIDAIMDDTLLGQKQNPPVSEPEVACNWLKNNRPVWEKWIPDATVCSLGYGVVDGAGAFVNAKVLATACAACIPGKFSQITEDSLTHVCEECSEGRSSSARSSACNEALVEEAALSTLAIIGIILAVIVFCGCILCGFDAYRRKHVRVLKKNILSLQQEVKELQDSAVNMRTVKESYNPRVSNESSPPSSMSLPAVPSKDSTPKERAVWYWREDPTRMSAHSPTLCMDPHWVQYAGSVAVELEEHYNLFLQGSASEEFATDLADRISSTGNETKAYHSHTGTKYRVNFTQMKQINASSGYKRDILRHVVPMAPSVVPLGSISSDIERGDSKRSIGAQRSSRLMTGSDIPVPAELKAEVLLVLVVGSIVQISKQRNDGWAFGNVILQQEEDKFSSLESISYDAGWFPMDCVTMPTKDDLERLAKMMGPVGVDCLAPPQEWAPVKDPMIAEQIELRDGPEKQRVVDWFGKTLNGKCKIVKVERIQNLSLWQSFAVKRQTMISHAGMGVASNGFERVWLFHGTNLETVKKIVQQGFNRSYCGKNATMYGKGVYFARDAAYSARSTYSAPDSSGIQRMFLCRVMVGEFCKGIKDALSPESKDSSGTHLYDSTVDTVKDPSIFVTYHDAQAYPDYLVHFRTSGS